MAIEFHCEFCGKQVRAQDEHAGKRAKCPSCHQSVYVPTPSDQIEALGIEPLLATWRIGLDHRGAAGELSAGLSFRVAP
mgnify:CR=1 FL=1